MIAVNSLVTTKQHKGNIIWTTLLHFCFCNCCSFSVVQCRENQNFTCRKISSRIYHDCICTLHVVRSLNC